MTKKYEKYKSSGVEWIGDIPEHWERSKVKFIADYINGCAFKPSEWTGFLENSKPIIRIQNLTSIEAEPNYFIGIKPLKYLVKKDDILISWSASLGVYVWKGDDAWLNQHIFKVDNIKKFIDKNYYIWLSRWFIIEMSRSSHGSTMEHLTKDAFGSFEVYIPKYYEQEKIANYLDKKAKAIDNFIKNKEYLINLLEEEKKANITKAVTKGLDKNVKFKNSGVDWLGDIPEHWKVYRTKFLFSLITKPSGRKHDHELLSIYTDIGVKPRKELAEKGNKASSTDGYWLVKKGDFIVNKLLAWMGAIGLSEYDGVTSPAYDILRKNKNLDEYYYNYLFRCGVLLEEIKKHSKGIMEMRLRLYFTEFGKIFLPYPSFEEQQEIVAFLDKETKKIDELKAKYRQEIDLIKEYKERLIYDVVTGKMNVLEH